MEFITQTQDELDFQLTPEAQDRASASFQQLREGKAPTPRTPFYKGLSEEEVFEEWTSFLTRLSEKERVLEPLISYDLSRMSKVGPQGGYPPFDERLASLKEYYTLPDQEPKYIDFELCREIYLEVFGGARDKRPMSIPSVVNRDQYDDKLLTNSGCPDFGKRKEPSILAKAISDAESGKWKDYVMLVGSRSQRGKDRFIFMAPFSLNLVEKRYLYPLMDIIRERNIPFFSAWEGFSEVELGFEREKFFQGDVFIQQDYTSMDKSINETCIAIFLAIVNPVFQRNYQKSFASIVTHIFDIPVMYALGKIIVGRHGMPSGSGLTNFFESIISYYVWKLNVKRGLNITSAQGLGDDLAFSIKDESPPSDEEIQNDISATSASIGLVVEPSKQLIDRYTTIYLQRFFDVRIPNPNNKMVLGMYPSVLAINTAMNPERFHDARKWSGEMEILRWIMILENCKNLPYFSELVLFFIEGDKFKLGIDIPDFFDTLPSLYEESGQIKGFLPTYNQEGLDRGIDDFETVKLLKEIAKLGL
jgi:hypothetical protein